MKIMIYGGKGSINPENTSWWFTQPGTHRPKTSHWVYDCKNPSTYRPASDTDNRPWSLSTSWQSETLFKYFTMMFLLLSIPIHQWLQAQAVSMERFWPIRCLAAALKTFPMDTLSLYPSPKSLGFTLGRANVPIGLSSDMALAIWPRGQPKLVGR